MPIYEYFCSSCEKTYELIQPVGASKAIECEDCGGLADRIISLFSTNLRSSAEDRANKEDPLGLRKIKNPAERERKMWDDQIRGLSSSYKVKD